MTHRPCLVIKTQSFFFKACNRQNLMIYANVLYSWPCVFLFLYKQLEELFCNLPPTLLALHQLAVGVNWRINTENVVWLMELYYVFFCFFTFCCCCRVVLFFSKLLISVRQTGCIKLNNKVINLLDFVCLWACVNFCCLYTFIAFLENVNVSFCGGSSVWHQALYMCVYIQYICLYIT